MTQGTNKSNHSGGVLVIAALISFCLVAGLSGADESAPASKIENLQVISPRLLSGGQPEGEAAFAELARRGVKTIISVDAAEPDLELARKHGIKYIHLPIGYDGVPRSRQCELIEAARRSAGPVFVHCHHGKHRGPAATAIIARGQDSWTADKGLQYMQTAGTDPKYKGLYQSVKDFQPITDAEQAAVAVELAERVKPTGLAAAMLEIDHAWDRLKPLGAKSKVAEIDVLRRDNLHAAAVSLQEHLREFARLPDAAARNEAFQTQTTASLEAAKALEEVLSREPPKPESREWREAYTRVEKSCVNCHAAFRDNVLREGARP